MKKLPTVEEQDAILEVAEAQASLSARIRNPYHSRERPDLEADAEERRDFCQSCLGTGRYLAGRCPDCQNED